MLDNGLKPYSCCHLIHAALDALDNARGKQVFAPEDVVEINVATNSEPILSHIGSIIEPDDILGAQFSLPFSMDMRLYGASNGMPGGNGFWDYLKVDFGRRNPVGCRPQGEGRGGRKSKQLGARGRRRGD